MIFLNASSVLTPVDIVTIFLAVAGIVIATILSFVFFRLTTKRGIAYDVIFQEETHVKDEYDIKLKLWNSGRSAIMPDEYGSVITFNFGANASVVEAKIINTDPKSNFTDVKINKDAGKVIIGQKVSNTTSNREEVIGLPMLNANNWIKFSSIVGNYTEIEGVDGHISDINNNKIRQTPYNLDYIIKLGFYITGGLCFLFLLGTILWTLHDEGNVVNQSYDLVALLIVWVSLLSYLFKAKKKHLYAIFRKLPSIVFVIISYVIVHLVTIAYLPAFLALGKPQ